MLKDQFSQPDNLRRCRFISRLQRDQARVRGLSPFCDHLSEASNSRRSPDPGKTCVQRSQGCMPPTSQPTDQPTDQHSQPIKHANKQEANPSQPRPRRNGTDKFDAKLNHKSDKYTLCSWRAQASPLGKDFVAAASFEENKWDRILEPPLNPCPRNPEL